MAGVKDGKRPYRSPVREENARRTRQAVVRAATELFVARGYAATSLADVAAEAGVARPTVFAAFGSKAALLQQVLDEALAGDDEPVPVARRPWFQPVWEAPDQGGVLDAYAGVCTLIGHRAAGAFETVRRAADEAPEAAELWETLLRNRRAGARMVVDRLLTLDGPLRPDTDTERAVDGLWFYNDPAHYAALVHRCGWTEESFRRWLGARMRDALLPA
ncbi:TetR/AcrR family transcriptional regulator [Micromonospora sediminicola]|uniref:TetR/AcrR family transcriptional regulator n=1 Tax=Micromonospora sediminicola TaxID=946078 RepID=UPI0033B8A27A